MKNFTFSSVPTRVSVEQLAQYQRKELEHLAIYLISEIERLENRLVQAENEINALKTN